MDEVKCPGARIMADTLFDLTGHTAVVTGASRGLGQYMARALARAGADVVITSRDKSRLAETQRDIEAMGRRAWSVELDVLDKGSIDRFADWVGKKGKVEILVNNAGCNVRKPAVDVTWEDWELIVNTNLRGPFFIAQAHDPSPLRPHHQYRLGHVRGRLRQPCPVLRQPGRHQADDHEPGR
jgi:NAD(P)-dependent dehydrogenase (short-subunit alcohol dehydrogenase family)